MFIVESNLLAQSTSPRGSKNKSVDAENLAPVVIAELPILIDPVSLVDKRLVVPATIRFEDASLSEVAEWIQQQTKLNVVLRTGSLEIDGILPTEPVTDSLDNAPVYMLLDRLSRIGVQWRLAGTVLYLEGFDDDSAMYTIQYNVGDLLDKGFRPALLTDAILSVIDSESWSRGGGAADAVMLGDVLFVRQSSAAHRQVAGFLSALRSPSRRVLIDEPEQNSRIREALKKSFTVSFKAKNLGAIADGLSKETGVEVRLDRKALQMAKVSDRTPVSLEVNEQPLKTILDLLSAQQKLAWIIRDGVLWITTDEAESASRKIGIFDVRDLCKNMDECGALSLAIQQQASPHVWESNGGEGSIVFPASGIMAISQTEVIQDKVLSLLENYRIALRTSKRRIAPDEDPELIETQYYRLPTQVAKDLELLLPSLLKPGTWRSVENPDAPGKIYLVKSWDQVSKVTTEKDALRYAESFSVLVVTQKKAIQKEILPLLERIEFGDHRNMGMPAGGTGGGMGGMGGGMGGGKASFGGGMFSASTDPVD